MMAAEMRVWCGLTACIGSWWHLLHDYYSELLLSKQEVSLCLSKGDQMAVSVGPDPGVSLASGLAEETASVSGDDVRRDRAGLSSDITLMGHQEYILPLKDFSQLFVIAWNSTSDVFSLDVSFFETLLKMKRLQERV